MKYVEILNLAYDQAMTHWYDANWFLEEHPDSEHMSCVRSKWFDVLTELSRLIAVEEGRDC